MANCLRVKNRSITHCWMKICAVLHHTVIIQCPYARGANVTADHAILQAESALCPANLTVFEMSEEYNEFFIESNLEIYITTC